MSEVNRYNVVLRVPNDSPFRQTGDSCLRPKNAEVVLASDYDALAADNKRIREALERTEQLAGMQLELISSRAPGRFLDKAPIVRVLRRYAEIARAALAGSKEGDL